MNAIREDIDRYLAVAERDGLRRSAAQVVLQFTFLAVTSYRVAHASLTRVRPRFAGRVLATVSFLCQRLLHGVTGIEIEPHAHLGPGLLIPHGGNIVIGPVRIGRHCTISHGVTLGQGLVGDRPVHEDTPVLGDRVWVGPGAVIAGPIKVGSDASVGANSVLLRDVPPRGVVLGVPARLVSHKGSFTQIYYRGMEDDAQRRAAREQSLDTPGPESEPG